MSEKLSDCCYAFVDEEEEICLDCKEPCGVVEDE